MRGSANDILMHSCKAFKLGIPAPQVSEGGGSLDASLDNTASLYFPTSKEAKPFKLNVITISLLSQITKN